MKLLESRDQENIMKANFQHAASQRGLTMELVKKMASKSFTHAIALGAAIAWFIPSAWTQDIMPIDRVFNLVAALRQYFGHVFPACQRLAN